MIQGRLTPKQEDVLRMRNERGATIEQIAGWLGISRRAVLYRLGNARQRGADVAPALPRGRAGSAGRERSRLYNASQISSEVAEVTLDIDGM